MADRSAGHTARRGLPVAAALVAASLLSSAASAKPTLEPAYHTPVAPYSGYVNHAHTHPTYRWGWFGAEHFYPRTGWHRDYNGNLLRWSHHRRY